MSVTVDNQGAIDLLEGMEARAVDLSPVLTVIAEDLLTFTDDAFAQSRAPSGDEWAPLAPATVRRRRQGSDTPLVDTGNLRGSITAVAGALSIELGTNTPYAGFHQFGTVHIPARPFLPFTADNDIVTEGPAEAEWLRYEAMIAHYIETGEILED